MSDEGFRPSYDTCDEVTDRCPVEYTMYGTELSKGAAYFFGIAFAGLLILQVYLGIRARAWSFAVWLGLGTILEVIGYWARTRLADNPWSLNSFIAAYLALLLAPTLVAAAISVTFKHLVIWYGSEWSVIRPALYPWVFVGTDLVSITIQIIGGGATAMAVSGDEDNETVRKLGEYMVIGGVSFQVANMFGCALLMILYWRRRRGAVAKGAIMRDAPDRYVDDYRQHGARLVHRLMSQGRISMSRATATDAEAKRVHIFCYALAVAYGAIIIRCIYRILENIEPISKDIMKNEPLFLSLDGAMILIAIGAVTFFHPFAFFPFLGVKDNERKHAIQHGGYQMRAVPR